MPEIETRVGHVHCKCLIYVLSFQAWSGQMYMDLCPSSWVQETFPLTFVLLLPLPFPLPTTHQLTLHNLVLFCHWSEYGASLAHGFALCVRACIYPWGVSLARSLKKQSVFLGRQFLASLRRTWIFYRILSSSKKSQEGKRSSYFLLIGNKILTAPWLGHCWMRHPYPHAGSWIRQKRSLCCCNDPHNLLLALCHFGLFGIESRLPCAKQASYPLCYLFSSWERFL